MCRPLCEEPALCHHKPTGHAYFRFRGSKPIYCGRWGSQEARDKHRVLVAEWIARGRQRLTTHCIPDQHSMAGRAPSRVGITRAVSPGRSVAEARPAARANYAFKIPSHPFRYSGRLMNGSASGALVARIVS